MVISTFEDRGIKIRNLSLTSGQPTGATQIIMDEITQLVKQEEYRVPPLFKFNVRKNAISESLTEKFSQKTKLGDLTEICIGIQLGGSQKNNTKESFLSAMQSDVNYKPVLDGKEINRYTLKWTKRFVNYGNWLHRKRDEKFFLNQKIRFYSNFLFKFK